MIVLGMSAGHDRGAVLIKDGKILIGITQSRLSRIKGDGGKYRAGGEGLPLLSIDYCLNQYGLSYDDVDRYVYSSTESFTGMEDQFEHHLKQPIEKLKFIPHHLAHAYSSFYSSGFEEAAVVVADAMGNLIEETNSFGRRSENWYPNLQLPQLPKGGSWGESISIYHFKMDGYSEVFKKWQPFPHPYQTDGQGSLGTMYGMGTYQLVYNKEKNDWSAGKLMGLASYAEKNFVDGHSLSVKELENDISIQLIEFYPEVRYYSDFYQRANVAGLYQREQEQSSLILSRMAKRLTGSKNICVAGGSFLNCNSNELIIKSNLYENCYFVPPADDSGIPLGCAWYGYQSMFKMEKTTFLSPYLGKSYTKGEIKTELDKFPECEYDYFEDFDELVEITSQYLSENKVIGWMQGGSEIGPRALGNRSILANPSKVWMEKNINHLKGREWFRPFAPSVLFEKQSDVFESDVFSPYMLVTTSVKEEWINKIPAVTHIDNSSRHQSVTMDTNPKFYKLIKKFYKKTNIPLLLNTSFNGPDEPIVETPYDALNTFVERKLDILVIGNFIVRRKNS
jgi:carbamoyltransferase